MRNKFTFATSIIVAIILFFSYHSFGQGTETFANFPETTSSYNDGTFTGQDGSTWDYVACRGDAQVEIDGETPGMQNDASAMIESGTISGGIGTLNFDYMQCFSTDVELEVYVNGDLITTVTSSGEAGTVKNSGDIDVNVGGDFTIKFDQTSSGGQVSVDNVDWTAYSGTSITNITASPEYPTSEEAVTVTADVTDSEGTIQAVSLAYGTTSGTLEDTVDMSSASGDTWEGDIPSHADETEIFYTITAVNDQDDTTTTDEMSYTVVDPYVTLPYEEDFEAADNFGSIGWTTQVVIGSMDWYIDNNSGGDHFAEMSNFDTDVYENFESETWLITPGIDLSSETKAYFGFENAYDYGGDSIEVYASTNYNGDAATADWDSLAPVELSTGSYNDVFSGYLDFSAYAGDTVHVAFKYIGTDSDGSTWRIDDLSVVSELAPSIANVSIAPENPTSDSTVTVTADVTHNDPGATIDTVYLAYGVASGTLEDTIGMIISSGDTYETETDIPEYSDGTEVFYQVTARDNNDNKTTTEEMSYTVVDPSFVTLPFNEDFEATTEDNLISNDLTNWMNYTPIGNLGWYGAEYSGNKYAEMASYGTGEQNEAWLITPGIDKSGIDAVEFTFDIAVGYYTHDGLTVMISEDFDGTDVASATWTDITNNFTIPVEPTGGFGSLNSAGTMDISSYADTVHIAFKYNGDANNSETTTYQIDNVSFSDASLPQISNITIDPEEPTSADEVTISADATVSVGTIDSVYLAWGTTSGTLEDTIGMVLTSGNTYTSENVIPTHVSGTEIFYEITAITLANNTTTTNELSFVFEDIVPVDLPFLETFETDFGQMKSYNTTGDQEWEWSSFEGENYVQISGYDGSANKENEDWLITPPLNFTDVSAAYLEFKEAINYPGNIDEQQEVYVSTDYAGTGDPTSATWTKLTVTNRAYGDGWEWSQIDPVDLSDYAGESEVFIALKYTSTSDVAAYWEVDSIFVESGALPNRAPEISNASFSPNPPTDEDDVQVSADITDPDGDPISATLYWGTASDAMTNEETFSATGMADQYTGTIPAQDAETHVYFKIEAEDGEDTTTFTDDYPVESSTPDGIEDLTELDMEVYPNPSNGQFNIVVNENTTDNFRIAVFNVSGQLVYQSEFNAGQESRKTINITNLSDGIYYLQVRSDKAIKVIKLLKQ